MVVPVQTSMLRCVSVSTGIAHGKAYVLSSVDRTMVPRRRLAAAEVETEIARFDAALTAAEKELLALGEDVARRIGASEADIFKAQALVVRDNTVRAQVVTAVQQDLVNVEAALVDVVEKFTQTFDQIPDAYLRERAADVRDVGRRILAALATAGEQSGFDIPEGAILVADELLPSATARFELSQVKALVTERGGRFSHTSILARSMRIPALTGLPAAPPRIRTGDYLIVDGVTGILFVNPNKRVRGEYERLEAELTGYRAGLQKGIDLPSVTLDGTVVPLFANASKVSDTEAAHLYRADGIGLYRTEFAFSIRSVFPTEEEQYQLLKRAAERMHPRTIVLRLLDLGGDKQLPYFPLPASHNPSLAQRGIRLLLKNPEVLKPQLRAFLRVSADHPVSVLLPVVGGLEEVRGARAVLGEVMAELAAEGKAFNPRILVGAMIEIPSAATLTAVLAKELDFFSLGTNDLVQYLLAADREDNSVTDYYQPLHPAVLRSIRFVADAARTAGRPLTICGEMAGEPAFTELLLGLGLRAFSVAPGEMLEVKNAIRTATIADAEALANAALELGSTGEIVALLEKRRAAKSTS
jgi:phosphoenolpyruvate-protein phosphotransferase (PTS system enzyme I)